MMNPKRIEIETEYTPITRSKRGGGGGGGEKAYLPFIFPLFFLSLNSFLSLPHLGANDDVGTVRS